MVIPPWTLRAESKQADYHIKYVRSLLKSANKWRLSDPNGKILLDLEERFQLYEKTNR